MNRFYHILILSSSCEFVNFYFRFQTCSDSVSSSLTHLMCKQLKLIKMIACREGMNVLSPSYACIVICSFDRLTLQNTTSLRSRSYYKIHQLNSLECHLYSPTQLLNLLISIRRSYDFLIAESDALRKMKERNPLVATVFFALSTPATNSLRLLLLLLFYGTMHF